MSPRKKTLAAVEAPAVPAAPEHPRWRQDEMLPLEEYPTGAGVAKYQATRAPADLSEKDVRDIRRAAKLKQDLRALARHFRISSKACAEVATLRDRAEVPSDFETDLMRRQREAKHRENLDRAKMAEAIRDARSKRAGVPQKSRERGE